MAIRIKRKINGKTLSLEAGKMAKQANGAVLVQYGDTVVLSTATMDEARPGIDFFPLTVDYREKTAAAGKIPGGFFKREGRPTTKEILTCRMIDRPTRPLFPDGFRKEIQIQCLVLSADEEQESDILAMLGASAALAISDIPWNGPTGSVRMGYVDGKIITLPTFEQIEKSQLNLIVSGTRNALTMVEAGAHELPEATIIDALEEAQRVIRTLVGMVEELVTKIGREKIPFEGPETPELLGDVRAYLVDPMTDALSIPGKRARTEALAELKRTCLEHFVQDEDERVERAKEFGGYFGEVLHEVMRRMIREGTRVDGRGHEDIRPITSETSLLPRTHGSALFTRGETQALATCTLGTTADKQIVDGLQDEVKKHFLLHYNFPPFSVGECRPIRGPGRREIGHGALAERALENVLPPADTFPYTIRIVSDVLESNGSSSMATVCSATLALMDAGVKIQRPVAGIAMGLLKEEEEFFILSDILGDEDHHGDMDFKVAGTDAGITALQMDIKIDGVTRDVLADALDQAREGRLHILREMKKALPRPRPKLSPFAPRFSLLKINPDKIGLVIGPGGKTVRKIQEETGAKIEIVDEAGNVAIYATSDESLNSAQRQVEAITAEAEVGKSYRGRVTGIKDFGAFIEVIPGQDGLLHISDMGDGYVDRVSDLYRPGDEVEVIVEDINDFGKIRLVLPESRESERPEPKPEKSSRRGDRRKGRRHDDKPEPVVKDEPEPEETEEEPDLDEFEEEEADLEEDDEFEDEEVEFDEDEEFEDFDEFEDNEFEDDGFEKEQNLDPAENTMLEEDEEFEDEDELEEAEEPAQPSRSSSRRDRGRRSSRGHRDRDDRRTDRSERSHGGQRNHSGRVREDGRRSERDESADSRRGGRSGGGRGDGGGRSHGGRGDGGGRSGGGRGDGGGRSHGGRGGGRSGGGRGGSSGNRGGGRRRSGNR